MEYLGEYEINMLGNEIDEAERIKNLTQKQLDIIYEKKLFNMFVPLEYGGLGCNLLQGIKIQESLARIDGSLGWTVTMCAGANMFVGYLDKYLAKMIFQDKKVCFAGSGEIGGVAKKTEKGYIINGKWNYIVGLPLCTIFTANCHIEKNGKLCYNENGTPEYSSFFFFPNEVEVVYNNHALGLIASAGHSFKITDLEVISKREFHISSTNRVIDSYTYQFPFKEYSFLTLTANHLGMQGHFLEALSSYLSTDEESIQVYNKLVSHFQIYFIKRRDEFYFLVEQAWEQILISGNLSDATKQNIEYLCKEIVLEGRDSALKVLQHLGMNAMQTNVPINRVVRDILTASQFDLLVKKL